MEQTILTEAQKRSLDFFKKNHELSQMFYLSGGTALSEFYFHHRLSDDLDFFTFNKDFPQLNVENFAKDLSKLVKAKKIAYRKLYDRRLFLFTLSNSELKIEFTYYPFATINRPRDVDGLMVDSLQDITANKMMALFDRIDPKDFVDLYFIVKENGISVQEIRELVKHKFQMNFPPIAIGSEFAKVRNLEALPKMIKPISLVELKNFFADEAKKLKTEILE